MACSKENIGIRIHITPSIVFKYYIIHM